MLPVGLNTMAWSWSQPFFTAGSARTVVPGIIAVTNRLLACNVAVINLSEKIRAWY